MREILYSLSIKLYGAAVKLAGAINPKAESFVAGRKDQQGTLSAINPAKSKLIWMHCASLGEFEQGRPVLEELKKVSPHSKLVLSFFSPSGFEIHKNNPLVDHVLYLPLDTKHAAQTWVQQLSPTLAIFVKYEYWHNYTKELAERNIPIISISSIFRSSQPFFKWYGNFNRSILQRFSHFFVQDETSKSLLESIKIKHVTVSGDTRFDRVYELSKAPERFPEIESLLNNGKKTFVIGSAWQEDMEVLSPFINNSDLNFIIAPHDIKESFMSSIEFTLERETVRYSNLTSDSKSNVMIIDNVGMLSSLYQYASFAWIGGAYGKGLHNTLEASVYGIPIFFGDKNYDKFREAMIMIEKGGAFAIRDYADFCNIFDSIDQNRYDAIRNINLSIVKENLGATQSIVDFCVKNYDL